METIIKQHESKAVMAASAIGHGPAEVCSCLIYAACTHVFNRIHCEQPQKTTRQTHQTQQTQLQQQFRTFDCQARLVEGCRVLPKVGNRNTQLGQRPAPFKHPSNNLETTWHTPQQHNKEHQKWGNVPFNSMAQLSKKHCL